MTTPAPLSTLPPLKPGEVWFCDPYWRDWSPIGEDELSVWNQERAARRLSPVQSGTPPAGSKVWLGLGYAIYQPETT